jgi:8-oxo-(d)GTP phosphatase
VSAHVVSAGCLVTRRAESEVLLVHPCGASFRKPLFGIPKGLVDEGEDLEAAAVRETFEETGVRVVVQAPLGSVIQKGGRKRVHAFWAIVAAGAESAIDERGSCPGGDGENDVCKFYPLEQAYAMMIPAQCVFLDRLREHLRQHVEHAAD